MITQFFTQLAIFDAITGESLAIIPMDNVSEIRYSRVLNGIGKIAITF
jgi:hypothetical protein